MFKILTDIKNLFLEKFSNYIETGIGDRGKIISSFVDALHQMLEPSETI
jgi:hypothetical protein